MEPLFAPFTGWLINVDFASRVIAGAYDAKSPSQRREVVQSNPLSYLGVTRSREDLADDDLEATDDDLLQRGADSLSAIVTAGAFRPSAHSALYAYRLTFAGHAQTGVVGAMHIDGFKDGRVLTHENVRPNRASLLGRHLQWVGATSSPIALTHNPDPAVARLLEEGAQRIPDVDHIVEEVRHQVWTLTPDESNAVAQRLSAAIVYVTDGHHRSAAALVGAKGRDEGAFQRTLAVLFPNDALRVEAFHRRCFDTNKRDVAGLIDALATVGSIEAVASQEEARPQGKGEIGVYRSGRWWRLLLHPVEREGALAQLDVERLRRDVISRLLGVDELRPDSGVDYVPAPSGIDEVVSRCDEDGRLGFIMHPTSIEDLMAVADAHDLMPPKSSYVAPKPRSGIFLRVLGTGATAHLEPS